MTVMTKPLTIYAPLGLLGYGYPEASLRAALDANPELIAVDAGSTDAMTESTDKMTESTDSMMTETTDSMMSETTTP